MNAINWKLTVEDDDLENNADKKVNGVEFSLSARTDWKNEGLFIAQVNARFGFVNHTIFRNGIFTSMEQAVATCESEFSKIKNETDGMTKDQTQDYLVKMVS